MAWGLKRRLGGVTAPSDSEAREFAAAFRSFLEWVHSDAAGSRDRNEVAALVGDFLGEAALERSVVTRSLAMFEQVNLQTALDAWSGESGRTVDVHGISIPPHFGSISLQQLLTGDGMPPLRLSAPPLVDLPNGPGSMLACLQLAVLLVTDANGRYVVMVRGPGEHDRTLGLEIAGLSTEAAQAVHARLEELRSQLNVYRGHVLEVGLSPMGGVTLEFGDIPLTGRDDVVLTDAVLARAERHALGSASELARDLQPAAMVLEDVDLVAEDRSFGPGVGSAHSRLPDNLEWASNASTPRSGHVGRTLRIDSGRLVWDPVGCTNLSGPQQPKG